MIERVARAICQRFYGGTWDSTSAFRKQMCFDMAIAAIEAMPGWEPIETAPRDVLILGCQQSAGDFENRMSVCWSYPALNGKYVWMGTGGLMPTHWMPLPAPPAALKPEVQP